MITFTTLREEHLVTGMTTATKKVLKSCALCIYEARLESQKIGALPRDRVSAARAFEIVGVDYFGAVNIAVERKE